MIPSRVAVVGCSGSGKTTLSLAIGRSLGLPVIHLDAEFWRPGWRQPERDEWAAQFDELVRRPRWVMDGTYLSTQATAFGSTEVIVDLELPRRVSLRRTLQRRLRDAGRNRPDLAAGCPERLRWELVRYIWRFPKHERPRLEALEAASGKPVIRLRSASAANRFIAGLPATLVL